MSASRSAATAAIDVEPVPHGLQPSGSQRAAGQPPECLRGIVFDAPDVLYDATAWRRWLWRLIGHFGRSMDYTEFARSWDAGYLVDVHCGRREITEAFESFLLSLGLTWGQIDEIEAAGRVQLESEVHARPWPGVVRTIGKLAGAGVPLVAWADLPQSGPQVGEFFTHLGLGDSFCSVLTSLDCESTQPAIRCYECMTAALELPPAEILYVGHDAQHLAAAHAFGLKTAAVNYMPDASADWMLSGCEDVLRLPLSELVHETIRRPLR